MGNRREPIDISDITTFSLLCVNKVINREASEVFYEINEFWFTNCAYVHYFAEQTLARGGENYLNRVTKVVFEIDFFTDDKDGTIDHLGLRELFSDSEGSLRKLFPSMKSLVIDFADSDTAFRRSRCSGPNYADDEIWRDMFQDLWDVMWRHPLENVEVVVWGLREPENRWHMARDLMGLEYEEYVCEAPILESVDSGW